MIIQWSGEDSTFIVTLPEFDNCKTHGDTYQEAVRNAEEVLHLLIETCNDEGLALPEPLQVA
jgi:antitoxin HicB